MQRIVILVALAALIVPLAGCGDDPERQGGQTSADQQERLNKARDLFMRAQGAMMRDKIDLYEQLIGLYPESPYAPQAHFDLIRVLHDPSIERHDDALQQTRSFSERHPASPLVAEAWSWMARHWRDPSAESKAIRDEWRAYLAKTRERDDLGDGDRAFIWLQSGFAAAADGDKAGGLVFLERASEWRLENKPLELKIAFRTGSLQKDLGKTDAARGSFERALALARGGAIGAREATIQAEIDSLGRD